MRPFSPIRVAAPHTILAVDGSRRCGDGRPQPSGRGYNGDGDALEACAAIPMTVWDKLIAGADDQVLDRMPF